MSYDGVVTCTMTQELKRAMDYIIEMVESLEFKQTAP